MSTNFWKDLRNFSEKSQQNYISKSKEAITDALNDSSEEMPDDVGEEDTSGASDPSASGDDMGGDMGGMDSGGDGMGGGDDAGGGMDSGDSGGMDMGGDDMGEDPKIKKNKYASINGKIKLAEQYDILIDSAEKAKEMFTVNASFNNNDIIEDLAELIKLMEDAKSSLAFCSEAENLTRYNMYYNRLESLLNQSLNEKNLIDPNKEEN